MSYFRLFISCLMGLGLSLVLPGLLRVSAQGPDGHATYYVSPGSNCYGATPCFDSVQVAVDAADAADDVVKISGGTYTGVSYRAGVTQVVYISKTITLCGGYTPTNWAVSNPAAYPTRLDAQDQGRVLYITGPISPTLIGLELTGGNATGLGGAPWSSDVGGGVYIVTATVTLTGNHIFSNTAPDGYGGGLYLYQSPSVLHNNTISTNTIRIYGPANTSGGGLYLYLSDATLVGNRIISNTAYFGGGIHVRESNATLTDNLIADNHGAEGGGVRLYQSHDVLTGNTIISNTANMRGGGLFISYYSYTTLQQNLIQGNQADYGAGLRLNFRTEPTLQGNTIMSNTASVRGGGAQLELYSHATFLNNIFAHNQAGVEGSGLFISRSAPQLRHNTLADNTGGDGTAVYLINGSTPAFTNTILANHTVGLYVTADSTATLQATLWANTSDGAGPGAIITGSNNLWHNPGFVNAAAGDYHLDFTSPAIDAGIDAGVVTDIDGHQRPLNAGYDLGADEALARVYMPLILK